MIIKDNFIQYAMDTIIDNYEDELVTNDLTLKQFFEKYKYTEERLKTEFILLLRETHIIDVDDNCNITNGNGEVIHFNDFYNLLTR